MVIGGRRRAWLTEIVVHLKGNRRLIFTRASWWSANRLSPLADLDFPRLPAAITLFRKIETTSQPSLVIMSTITVTS